MSEACARVSRGNVVFVRDAYCVRWCGWLGTEDVYAFLCTF
jgi:hypothetical protein